MRWMNLEPIILSEVSQKEKSKYRIVTYIYGIQKDSTGEPICSSGDTDVENRLMDTACGEEGEGRMYGERNMETYITVDKIDSPREFAV